MYPGWQLCRSTVADKSLHNRWLRFQPPRIEVRMMIPPREGGPPQLKSPPESDTPLVHSFFLSRSSRWGCGRLPPSFSVGLNENNA